MGRWASLAGALLLAVAAGTIAARPLDRLSAATAARGAIAAPDRTVESAVPPVSGHVEGRTFWSTALGRTMPYRIYLPPGYELGMQRYPVLYLLHGMGGSDRQWEQLGIADAADRLIRERTIAPLLIVMPEGERAYWVDHATDGQEWGRYAATDVVSEIDSSFRTSARRQSRVIGGLSMGAHGALQLALNHPEEFAAVGAHSLVLRRFGSAPPYFGDAAEFAKRDPVQLVQSRGPKGCPFSLWIDIGDADPWAATTQQFEGELTRLGIRHEWHEWPGDHSGIYWSAHLADYLRFYDLALSGRASGKAIS